MANGDYLNTPQYWGNSYWGNSYWGLIVGVPVDIQYTEVMAFTVLMPMTASFTVEMPQVLSLTVYKELST